MTTAEKLGYVKVILGISSSDTTQDDMPTSYLNIAGEALLEWMYINYADGVPSTVTDIPGKYAIVQINAVVAGYNIRGGENQWKHSENGIVREWHYTDMMQYIRAHVNQIPKVG